MATDGRRKAVWGGRVRLGLVLLLAVLLSSCSEAVRSGQASSYLVLTSLQGAPGTAGTFGTTLQSDVLNVNPTTGATSIAADRGQASFTLAMKDVLNQPTVNNSITLTQYHVEYVRTDGRNVPGVDVPYGFDGAVTATVTGTATVGFTLVRIQAKEEAPLKGLAFGGQQDSITTIAKVTFYGHDQTGREVSVSGNIEITFSDWAG